ncbi:MAG: hypothetical protein ACT4P7_00825 [Gemmatimonadaceae bacterium]
MRLHRLHRNLALVGTLTFVAACSVSDPVAPTTVMNRALLSNGEIAGGMLAPSVAVADTQYKTFTIDDDASAWYLFGPHKLYMPSMAICDPATSGYGPSYWLQPCTAKTVNSTITAKWWTDSRGYVRAEFRPDLRFAPGKNVWLYLKDQYGAEQGSSAILYCIDGTDTCTNESVTDYRLQTKRDPSTGWVWRMIRHFSGYNVWA